MFQEEEAKLAEQNRLTAELEMQKEREVRKRSLRKVA